ncbi:endocuticle structural glycoprotein ABD-4-like [Wyeomyia smithii]|uniref:endocuticle structural glycoprotein ABD-4-like n=1 Tax=Wyeomyia smithii TaxID=174621 RepID=UPI002468087C|nr:endocuticle structural glycoprotein ABD-4-like [Wyeomyia smithii]
MNKQLALWLMAATCALAAPQRKNGISASNGGPESTATIVRQDQLLNPDGSYSFAYETSNGIKASESSSDGASATGEFSYTAPEGDKIQLAYVADQGGFQPQGAHLPVEPPPPEHVLKGLEIILANPPKDPDFNAAFLEATIARLKALQG